MSELSEVDKEKLAWSATLDPLVLTESGVERTLEVVVSSIETEDEALLHFLSQKTDVEVAEQQNLIEEY